MTIEWTETDLCPNALTARIESFELQVSPFGHENHSGPLWVAVLSDRDEALADRTWTFHVKDMDAAKARTLSLLEEFLTRQTDRQARLLEAITAQVKE